MRTLPAPAAAVLLALLTFAAYATSFSAGFAYDNKGLILDDPRVHSATSANLDLIVNRSYWWPQGESGLYRPLTTLSYLANYAILGNADRSTGYHVVNLLLHLANVLLLMTLLSDVVSAFRRTGPGPAEAGHYGFIAFAAAAIWAVHPLTTEAVTNIVGRADLLAAFGTLAALVAYARSRETRGTARVLWLAAIGVATAAGIASKESAVMILAIVPLFEIARWNPKTSVRTLTPALVAIAVPLAVYFAQRAAVLAGGPPAEFPYADNPIVGAGFLQGKLMALAVMGRYLALAAWPASLSADYSYAALSGFSGFSWFAGLSGFAVCFAAAFIARRREATFFAAFAFLALLPASNLIVLSGTIMAERLTYLPLAGVTAVFTIALFALADRLRRPKAAWALTAVIVVALAARTAIRSGDWRDDVTLWSATVDAVPDSAKAHHALAVALYDADPSHANIERVIAESDRGLAIAGALTDDRKPAQNYRQAAVYLIDRGDRLTRRNAAGEDDLTPDAAAAYRRAVALIQQYLAIVRVQTAARPESANGPSADAYRVLATLELRLREPKAALDAATEARAREPRHPVAYRAAAAALLDLDRPDDAAIALAQGILKTGDRGLVDFLAGLYKDGLDPDGCAVRLTPAGPAFDPNCAIVHRHFCAADPTRCP